MEFHQWLEFVLFPRMMEIVNSDNPLPQKVLIHTYAQEIYRGRWQEYKDLIKHLIEFDKIFETVRHIKCLLQPINTNLRNFDTWQF